MSCLYDSMKALGLADVDTVKPRYLALMKDRVVAAMGKEFKDIVREDPSMDFVALGTVDFLQFYCVEHPSIAFVLTDQGRSWVMLGESRPSKAYHIVHTGPVSGGHFSPAAANVNDLHQAQQSWDVRYNNLHR